MEDTVRAESSGQGLQEGTVAARGDSGKADLEGHEKEIQRNLEGMSQGNSPQEGDPATSRD